MRRSLVFVLGIAAAAALVGGAGGATGKLDLSTRAGVIQYLKAHGIDAQGIVIQRGNRNYVGAHCPGARWNCTRASRVVQVASGTKAINSVSIAADDQLSKNCAGDLVVQLNSGSGNNVVMASISSAASQTCHILQSTETGNNTVQLAEAIVQSSVPQDVTQDAQVTQYNTSGANSFQLKQSVSQSISENASSVSELQKSDQEFTVYQFNGTGTNSSQVTQSLSQTEYDPKATTGSQEQDATLDGHVNQTSTGLSTSQNKQSESQTQTAKPNGTVTQTQHGPSYCCSLQQSNLNDIFRIDQTATQQSGKNAFQTEEVIGTCDTSGLCKVSQSITQNGTTTTNSCQGTYCHTGIINNGEGATTCNGGEEGGCPFDAPPPPPPLSTCEFECFCVSACLVGPGAVQNLTAFASLPLTLRRE